MQKKCQELNCTAEVSRDIRNSDCNSGSAAMFANPEFFVIPKSRDWCLLNPGILELQKIVE